MWVIIKCSISGDVKVFSKPMCDKEKALKMVENLNRKTSWTETYILQPVNAPLDKDMKDRVIAELEACGEKLTEYNRMFYHYQYLIEKTVNEINKYKNMLNE